MTEKRYSEDGSWFLKEDDVAIVYMCGTAWKHHVLGDPKGTGIYPTLEMLKAERTCIAECGAVEVEVRVRRWAVPPEPTKDFIARKLSEQMLQCDCFDGGGTLDADPDTRSNQS
jgi:hypothetical protein